MGRTKLIAATNPRGATRPVDNFETGDTMTTTHNHPPRCCCPTDLRRSTDDDAGRVLIKCPQCVEHGELALLGKECATCHQLPGRPHTGYCSATGLVGADDRGTTLIDTGTMFATIPTTPRTVCPCAYTVGPVDHHPTCPDWEPPGRCTDRE